MIKTALAGAVAALLAFSPAAFAQDLPVRIAVLKTGTVNWLMETITANDLDHANGIDLQTVPLAGGAATAVAFQAGEVDMMVKDWVWAMYMRGQGREIDFAPFSNAVGSLISKPEVGSLCDLKGGKIGVVGGELDKSWIIIQALTTQECGFDITQEAEILFGAPPLMSKQLLSGEVDAVSTYWHFAAKLEAAGMKRLQGVDEAMVALGISPTPPLIGFVWDAAKTDPAAMAGFLRAAEAARGIMADEAAWEPLRPMMRAANDAEFEALRDAYRAGRPGAWTEENTASAKALYDLLAKLAGEGFTSEAGAFEPDVFRDPTAPMADAG